VEVIPFAREYAISVTYLEYSYPDGTHLNTNAVGLFAEQMGIAGWTAWP